jgi:23S rRNA pseudouridine2605 synthase
VEDVGGPSQVPFKIRRGTSYQHALIFAGALSGRNASLISATIKTVKTEERRIGLARALSKLGYCSRTRAAEFVRAGRVRLNGALRRDPETPVHLEKDRIEVDGVRAEPGRKIYLIMNKPRGLVTTAADEKGRQTIYSLLRSDDALPWLAPVGRLDKASEGLLLLTNDSEWAARVTAPETHLEKTYHVQIASRADEAVIETMQRGVVINGEILRARQCRLIRSGEKNSWLQIVLAEGRNRQIRRMLAILDIEVLRLVRVAIGPIQLGKLEKASYRALTVDEKFQLDNAITLNSRVRHPGSNSSVL